MTGVSTHSLSLQSAFPMKPAKGSKRKREDEVSDAAQLTFTEADKVSQPSPKKFKAKTLFSVEEDALIKYLEGQIKGSKRWIKITTILNKLELSTKSTKQISDRHAGLKFRGRYLITDADNVIIEKYKATIDTFSIEIPKIKRKSKVVWKEEETALLKHIPPIFNNIFKSISILFKELGYDKSPKQCSTRYYLLKNKNLTEKEQNIISEMKNIINKAVSKIPITAKRNWDSNEVSILIQGLVLYGQSWEKIEDFLKEKGVNRSARQAQDRFYNFRADERRNYMSELSKKPAKQAKTSSIDLPQADHSLEEAIDVPEVDFTPVASNKIGSLGLSDEEIFQDLPVRQ